MEGRVPPSDRRPHPVTVPFSPIKVSSVAGKQMGAMLGWKVIASSKRTRAKSYSYVKKLYFGWTIFFVTPRSINGYGS